MALMEFLWRLKIEKNNYRVNYAFAAVALGLISCFPTILNIGFQSVCFSCNSKYCVYSLNQDRSSAPWASKNLNQRKDFSYTRT